MARIPPPGPRSPIRTARTIAYAAAAIIALAPAVATAQAVQRDTLVIPRFANPGPLDGTGEESAWQAVSPLPVVMQAPSFGLAPTERTEVRVAHDGARLYVSGRLYDSEPVGIQAPTLKRDQLMRSSDWFYIILDTFDDNENAVAFFVNPAGARVDFAIANDAVDVSPVNTAWDTFWDAAVTRTEDGWFVEMRIPFSGLRFQTDEDGRAVMGLTAARWIARKNESVVFPAIPPRWGFFSAWKPSQAARVVFEDVEDRSPIHVTPYVLGGLARAAAPDFDGATPPPRGEWGELGLDLKYGVTTNLTLDVTVNTDFAQVEADEQQVNLTRFSLFFPERRRFFQERSAIFDFRSGDDDRLFYSRRMGLSGTGRPLRIYSGFRAVGRLGGWDLGVLDMQAQAEDRHGSENLGVARVRRQVFNPQSYAGAILTTRTGAGRTNAAFGVDAILRLFGNDYLSLNWAATRDGGDPPADDGVADDDVVRRRTAFGAASMLGYVQWQRRGVDGLTYQAELSRVGAAFDPRLGYIRRRDFTRGFGRVAYGIRPGPESPVLHLQFAGSALAFRRNGGSTESSELTGRVEAVFKNAVELKAGGSDHYEDLPDELRLSDDARIPAGRYRFRQARLEASTPTTALLRTVVVAEAGSFYDGRRLTLRLTPTWNASRHLQLGGTYQYDHIRFGRRGQRFEAHTARLRVELMFDTRLSASAFLQHNTAAGVALANLRLRYAVRDGEDLYVVFAGGRVTDAALSGDVLPHGHTRSLVLKYSRTFLPW